MVKKTRRREYYMYSSARKVKRKALRKGVSKMFKRIKVKRQYSRIRRMWRQLDANAIQFTKEEGRLIWKATIFVALIFAVMIIIQGVMYR